MASYRREIMSLKIPRLACWSFAMACFWVARESFGPDAGPGIVVALIATMAAVAAIFESGRDLDSAPAAFQAFWVLLSALVVPIAVTAVLLALDQLVDPGSDAPFGAIVLWLTLHAPFYAFMPRRTDSLLAFLTGAQWVIVAVVTARIARKWRVYEAVALAFATILTTGISIIIGLLLLGYRLQFEGP
jgi:hypothetical protein